MRFRRLIVNLAVLPMSATVLVGCQVDKEVALSPQLAAAHRPSNDAAHPSGGNCADYVVLSTAGVGGITAKTPATLEGLSRALPCFNIEQKTGASEGVSYPYLSASRNGVIQLSIIPKADGEGLYAVVISGGRVHNTLGHPIGSLFKDVFDSGDTTSCQPGMEELSGYVLCRAPSAQNIVYMFAGLWEGPDGEIPPGHVLGMWPLIRISWAPSGDK